MYISKKIKERIIKDNGRFWAGDNISKYIEPGDKEKLIDELQVKFEGVLSSLIIDTTDDPNSKDTAKRLAKMYVNELFEGRYNPKPNATAFPQETSESYDGIVMAKVELKSMCSHHHQPVNGIAYIGVIAAERLIGLSKYSRIAQWCARRGTLQEQLAIDIAREISDVTGSNDIGVYIQATHGCCENRGINAHDSLTQTAVLKGAFKDNYGTKKEFYDNIKIQQGHLLK